MRWPIAIAVGFGIVVTVNAVFAVFAFRASENDRVVQSYESEKR